MADPDTSKTTHRVRKAWQVSLRNFCEASPRIHYASTQGKARYQAYLQAVDVLSDLRIVDLIVRRAPWADVKLPTQDPRADNLTEDEKHCLLHAFGANGGDPTKAGYRDYFYTRRDDPPLVSLNRHGLMSPMDGNKFGEGMTYFVLTQDGKQVALSLTPEYGTNG